MAAPTTKKSRLRLRSEGDVMRAFRVFQILGIVAALLTGVISAGLFKNSIRPDPFEPNPSWHDWLFYWQPDRAMQNMTVVPIGPHGTLTFRPLRTDWINVEDPSVEEPRNVASLFSNSFSFVTPSFAFDAGPSSSEEKSLQRERDLEEKRRIDAQSKQQEQQGRPEQEKTPQQGPDPAKPAVKSYSPTAPVSLPGLAPRENPAEPDPRPAEIDATIAPGAKGENATPPPRPTSGLDPQKLTFSSTAACSFDGSRCLLANQNNSVTIRTNAAAGSPPNPDVNRVRHVIGGESDKIFSLFISGDGRNAEASIVGSGERYLMASADGGETWARLSPGETYFDTAYRNEIAVEPELWLCSQSHPSVQIGCRSVLDSRHDFWVDGSTYYILFFDSQRRLARMSAADYAASVPFTGKVEFVRSIEQMKSEFESAKRKPGPSLAAKLSTQPFPFVPQSFYVQQDAEGSVAWLSSGWNQDGEKAAGDDESRRPALFQSTDGGQTWVQLQYRKLPPPWILYVALPLLMLLLYGTFEAYRRIPDLSLVSAIVGRATPDRPITLDDPDVAGLKDLSLAIERFLRNPSTIAPLTVAIEGKWGTGKSSLMNLVRERLQRRGERSVWFNAWHQQNDEQLFAALFENIRSQAIPPFWQLSGIRFHVRLIWFRIEREVWGLLAVVLSIAACWYVFHQWLPDLGDRVSNWWTWGREQIADKNKSLSETLLTALVTIGGGLGTLTVVLKIAEQLIVPFKALNADPVSLLATMSRNSRVMDYSEKLSFHYRFAREFHDTCRALQSRTGAGLVIFIDDLDRCSEEQVMRVLEAVNFLATAGDCFVILGIDRERVKVRVNIAAKEDKDSSYAEKYLEKLFNMTIRVPEASVEATLALAIGALTDPAKEPGKPYSPWPERIRRAIRFAPEAAALPIAVLFTAFLITDTLGSPPVKQSAPTDHSSKPAGSSDKTTTSDDDSTPSPYVVSPSPPEKNIIADPTKVKPNAVSAAALARSSFLQTWIVPILCVLILVLLMLRRSALATEDMVEDSKDFLDAMSIWHPAVFALDPALRAIKKHQNRLRFQAMRVRREKVEADRLDDWFGNKYDDDQPEVEISDELLVTLGMMEVAVASLPSTSDALEDQVSQVTDSVFRQSFARFVRAFPQAWPPTDAQLREYKGLSRMTKEHEASGEGEKSEPVATDAALAPA
ncbi:MAG TPA: P-loop NTPase fold protein [Candidatus Limnocylindrales bacterium]|nr:P-loop NTPase fold protein [Candidatus Limnocylindrales bacterium]